MTTPQKGKVFFLTFIAWFSRKSDLVRRQFHTQPQRLEYLELEKGPFNKRKILVYGDVAV